MATTTSYTGDEPFDRIGETGGIERHSTISASDYNLTVPSSATVNGIIITWTGGASGWDDSTNVMTVAYAGSGNSSNLSSNAVVPQWQNTGTITFGGPTNLWGLTWTPAQAMSIATKFHTAGLGTTGYHDAFQVTIYYTDLGAAAPEGLLKLTSGLIQLTSGKILI